ncbi:MAG: S41 family peptidase [Pseudomonadota bacterium]
MWTNEANPWQSTHRARVLLIAQTGRFAGRFLLATMFLCLAQMASASAVISNPGFEPSEKADVPGWDVSTRGHVVRLDAAVRHSGKTSLRVESGAEPRGSMVSQELLVPELVVEGPLRLSGYIKSKGVDGTATFFVIVEGPSGQLFQDDMRDRPVVGTTDWRAAEINIPRFAEATKVKVGALVIGGGTAWFDSMELTSLDEDLSLSSNAKRYLDHAIEVMAKNSIKRQSIDWDLLISQAYSVAGGAQTPQDTYPAIRFAVQTLKDSHSSFMAPENPDHPRLSERAKHSFVKASRAGSIGYINLPSFQNRGDLAVATQFIDSAHRAIEDVSNQGVCGWVVDLRENLGGNMWPMVAAIGPILGRGRIGGFYDPITEARFEWWYESGKAGMVSLEDGTRSTIVSADGPPPGDIKAPVAVLTSRQTSSSGEGVALAFRHRPGTHSFGQPTAGLATANRPFQLEDRAWINLTTMYMTDRRGNHYPDTVIPDEVVESSPSSDAALEAANRWLAKHGCD